MHRTETLEYESRCFHSFLFFHYSSRRRTRLLSHSALPVDKFLLIAVFPRFSIKSIVESEYTELTFFADHRTTPDGWESLEDSDPREEPVLPPRGAHTWSRMTRRPNADGRVHRRWRGASVPFPTVLVTDLAGRALSELPPASRIRFEASRDVAVTAWDEIRSLRRSSGEPNSELERQRLYETLVAKNAGFPERMVAIQDTLGTVQSGATRNEAILVDDDGSVERGSGNDVVRASEVMDL